MNEGHRRRRVRIWSARCSVILGAASLHLAPSLARASCLAAVPEVLWSSPSDGAVGVPIDTDLLIAMQGVYGTPPEVTLSGGGADGVSVGPGSELPGHFDLGVLAPYTRYSLRIISTVDPTVVSVLRFETGEGQGSSGAGELRVDSVSEQPFGRLSSDLETCDRILFADTCFDTGVPPLQTFEVNVGSSPLDSESLWVIETITDGQASSYFTSLPVWCGPPAHIGESSAATDYRLYNVGANGVVRETELLEGPVVPRSSQPEYVLPPANTDASGASCEITSSGGANGRGALAMLSAFWATVALRRYGRTRRWPHRRA